MASKLAAIPASSYCPEGEIHDAENEPPETLELEEIPRHRQLRDELEEDLKIKVAEFESLFSEFRQNIQIVSPDVAAKIDPVFDQLAQGAAAQYRHMTADYLDAKHEDFKNGEYWEQHDGWVTSHIGGELRDDVEGLRDEAEDREIQIQKIKGKLKAFTLEKRESGRFGPFERKNYPKLQDALHKFLKDREAARIGAHGKDKEAYYVKQRMDLFIAVFGNKKINEYGLEELNNFATDLQFLPATFRKNASSKLQNPIDAIAANQKLYKTTKKVSWSLLSQKAIKDGYVGRVKSVMNSILRINNLDPKFKDLRVRIPDTSKGPVTRKPLTTQSVNRLFQTCANLIRPDDVFLPLLGALTGARIGELIYLQAKDIVKIDGGYVANLYEDIDINGKTYRRELKADGAERYIALHNVLGDLGFIRWAQAQKGFLFPHLHHRKIVSPADTASKRFQRIFKKLNLQGRKKNEQVFHSFRHLYKDILRDAQVNERTIDIQIGHSLGDYSRKYGSITLRPSEIKILTNLPLPEGIDFTPYKGFDFGNLDRFDEEAFEQRIREQERRARRKEHLRAKATAS